MCSFLGELRAIIFDVAYLQMPTFFEMVGIFADLESTSLFFEPSWL